MSDWLHNLPVLLIAARSPVYGPGIDFAGAAAPDHAGGAGGTKLIKPADSLGR
jgi:hypothetical protein